MFCIHVGKDKFRAVEKELQSRGFGWINGAAKFNPFNHTNQEKIWIQAGEDMDITWSEDGHVNGEILTLEEFLK